MVRNVIKMLFFCLFFLLSRDLFSCYSGLLVVPTTDITYDRVWVIDLQWEGYLRELREKQFIFNTEYGIGGNFEMGIDFNFTNRASDSVVLVNAKYLVYDRSSLKVAVGFYNLNSEFDYIPYIISSKDLKEFRVNLGFQREYDGKINYIAGLDKTFENGIQVCIDRINGVQNYLSIGVGYSYKNSSFMVGYQWPNGGGKGEFVFHLIFNL